MGTLFYRFISENFSNYIEAGDESVNYAELPDTVITKDIMEDAIKTKGYFIYPSQLFCNIAKNANTNKIFDYLENEIEYRECKIEVAFNKLINQLIEKKVVKNFEELSQIESYKKAAEHWDFIYKS